MTLFDYIHPIVDKINYTLNITTIKDGFNVLKRKLTEIIDKKPIPVVNNNKNIRGFKYGNGLFVVKPNSQGYCRIEIHPDKVDLLKLEEVFSQFRTYIETEYYEKRAQNIVNIEIAFDIDLGISDQETQEELTFIIAKYLRPKFIKSPIFNCIEGDNQLCSDGAINGGCTYYFNSKMLKQHTESRKYTNRGRSAIVYTKKLSKSEWCTRCEARLNKSPSMKLIGRFKCKIFELQNIVDHIVQEAKFDQYFEFESVFAKKFIKDIPDYINIEENNNIKKLMRLRKKLKRYNVSAHKKSVMKAIAKIPPKRTFENRIRKHYVKPRDHEFMEEKIRDICGDFDLGES